MMDGLRRLFGFSPDHQRRNDRMRESRQRDPETYRLERRVSETHRSARLIREEAERILRTMEDNPILRAMEDEAA